VKYLSNDKIVKNKVLVVGASGFVGIRIMDDWGDSAIGTHFLNPKPKTKYFDATSMDLESIEGVRDCSHAVILFGERDPDQCFRNPVHARKLNIEGTIRVIEQCMSLGIIPVFASSEAVFSGSRGLYSESDKPDPILVYGKLKVQIEDYLQKNCEKFIVLRFSRIIGSRRGDGSLLTNWLRQIEKGDEQIICAEDQTMSLISDKDLPHLLRLLILSEANGIFHISDGLRHNRIEILKQLISQAKFVDKAIRIERVSIDYFKSPETRPRDVSLSSDKIKALFNFEFRSLSLCIEDVLNGWS